MANRGSRIRRSEVTERVERHKNEINEQADHVEENVEDTETVRETIDNLKGGTEEGFDESKQHVESARDTSVHEFERNSDKLEGLQESSKEFEGELHEHSDTVALDTERISDASRKIHSDRAMREVNAARDSSERDKELLDEHEDRAREFREESQRIHDEYKGRVNAARGS